MDTQLLEHRSAGVVGIGLAGGAGGIGAAGPGGLAEYRYGVALPKPCVHPMVTAGGVVVSGFEMSDHVWHRGLWFTFKFVNGENFWEEHEPFGRQVSGGEPEVKAGNGGGLVVGHELAWTSPTAGVVMRERRRIEVSVRGGRGGTRGGTRVIDWESRLTPTRDVVLDRTPYTTWGGYGGLGFRASREVHEVKFAVPGKAGLDAVIGERHPWCVMHGKVDGGKDRSVSVGMVDHPGNVRADTTWYCKTGNGFTFLHPAPLFAEALSVAKGEELRLRYRVAWRDGQFAAGEFESLADQFRGQA